MADNVLITCTACNSKMRVPDSAVGKKVKCPKCGAVLSVPAAEPPPESITPAPPPPPSEPITSHDGTEVTAQIPASSVPKSPPPRDDEDDDDFEPPPLRRDLNEDDYLNVGQGVGRRPVNSMAMTSMIMGIVAITFSTVGCLCCGVFGAGIGTVCGIMALIFGFMGKVPGSESYAMTGIICGGVSALLGLIGIIAGILWIGLNIGMGGFG